VGQPKVETFFETKDVARVWRCSNQTVRIAVAMGKLHPAAWTKRGTRLYREADVIRAGEQRTAPRRKVRSR